ncbi:hypothetical protein TASIC1_0017002700 [Trichoderma asperellum]|uniref:Uncharacterized protein n=1 Tax=Trichoderma asperellum TaxID=101201 RepID=A0A6V8R827_TRIAP|nr:hypothetical protein TASIC1_0017002700 [Trichoderma asperellum]
MAPYIISINNQSDSKQAYAIFAAAPAIKRNGDSAVEVVTRIITSVRGVASPQGQASFMLSKKLVATCGVYDVEADLSPQNQHRKRIGTGIEVVDQRAVDLGRLDEAGRLVRGTTLRIECSDGTPAFTKEEIPPSGALDCFSILTGRDFSGREDQYVVGFCSSMRQNIGPYATFVPEPGQEYQIAPSKIFYVVVGQFNPYDLTSPTLKDSPSTCKVDFGALGTDQVTLIHNDTGGLIRMRVPGEEATSLVNFDVIGSSGSADLGLDVTAARSN